LEETMEGLTLLKTIEPESTNKDAFEEAYQNWLKALALCT